MVTTADEARRFATLLRFDVVQSTNFTDMHPDDLEPLISFVRDAGDICVRHGARVESFQGDSLILSFAVSSAVSGGARRAVEAGLEVRNLIGERGDFDARIAIHHGLTQVVGLEGDGWSIGLVATGLGPTVVSRVEAAAPIGSVVITDEVADMVRHWFDIECIGKRELRGISEPVVLHVVRGPLLTDSWPPNDRGIAAGFVGRDLAVSALQTVKTNRAAELVVGPPGIGKSRLLQETFSSGTSIWIRCRPETQAAPLVPLIRSLGAEIGSTENAAVQAFLEDELKIDAELAAFVTRTLAPQEGVAPLTDRTQAVVSALCQTFTALADQRGGAVIVDDCQWADPMTRDWLIAQAGLLPGPTVVAAVRTDGFADWQTAWPGSLMMLDPLSESASMRLVESLVDEPGPDVDDLVERAEGVPFFLEELAHAHNKGLTGRSIPPSLRELLDYRIDYRPAIERTMMELLAVAGGTCPRTLVVRMAIERREEHTNAELALSNLCRAGLLQATGDDIAFGHDLLRQAAYDRIRINDQPSRHQLAAAVLEEGKGRFGLPPELIADQWIRGEVAILAGPHWIEAGVTAAKRGAQGQSIELLDRALASLGSEFPETLERQELWAQGRVAAQLWRATALVVTSERGYADDAVRLAYEEVGFLTSSIRDAVGWRPEIFPAYYGLWAYYVVRGEHPVAGAYADDLLSIADTSQAPEHRLIANATVGYQRMYEGKFDEAREFLTAATDFDVKVFSLPLPQDPMAVTLVGLAAVEQLCGQSEQVEELIGQCLRRIEVVPNSRKPFTEAFCRCFMAWIRQMMGDPAEALRQAELAEAAATRGGGYPTWETAARLHAGIARGALEEDSRPAAGELVSALETWDALGHRLMRPYFATHLASLLLRTGDRDVSDRMAGEARAQIEESGEAIWSDDLEKHASARRRWEQAITRESAR